MFTQVKPKRIALALAGSAILAFGLYNVHSLSNVTEGGVLGMDAPAPALVRRLTLRFRSGDECRLLRARLEAARERIPFYSLVSGGGFSLFYAVAESFPPLWPQLAQAPLLAAVVGAMFVGVGVGLSVRAGGAPGGDDALAMVLAHGLHWKDSVGLSSHGSDCAVAFAFLSSMGPAALFSAHRCYFRPGDWPLCSVQENPGRPVFPGNQTKARE